MAPDLDEGDVKVWVGDARTLHAELPPASADAIVTSPPYYGLRDYGVDGQIGLEPSPQEYIHNLADLLTAWGTSVLRSTGSLWLNLGDSYSTGTGEPNAGASERIGLSAQTESASLWRRPATQGIPGKCLLMIPERVALALIDRGWILRNKVVWAKPNGMPSSATDRLATKWEYLFHFVRQPRYWYDLDAIRQPHAAATINRARYGRAEGWDYDGHRSGFVQDRGGAKFSPQALGQGGANPGDWWVIPTQPYAESHYAVYPAELIRRPILATVPEGGLVVDPFIGSGTTAAMARRLGRRCWGADLDGGNLPLIRRRIGDPSLFASDEPEPPVPTVQQADLFGVGA